MPHYDYNCKTCNKTEEFNIPIKDYTPTLPCDCGSIMERVMSPIPFKFSGLSTGTTLTNKGKLKQPAGTVSYEEGKELAKNAQEDAKNKYKLSKADESFLRSI